MTETDPDDQPLTIAHLSDVHLGPLPWLPPALATPKRIAGTLNWYRGRRQLHRPEIADALARHVVALKPDHILVSGDLANIGLPAEIQRGAQWLGRLGAPDRVSVVPGNHDIYSTLKGVKRGVDALSEWQPHYASCAQGRLFADGQTFPFVRIIERGVLSVALIGLNTAVETPPLIASGRLGTAQCDALERVLAATRAAGLLRVVMLHHPPLPELAKAGRELTDAAALAVILTRHGADLVVHGHNHRRMINTVAGPDGAIPIIGVPSASAAFSHRDQPLARAHLFEFRAGTGTGRRAHITLIARGLQAPSGGIVELERLVL